eukprot:SAG31_NODE_11504_length_1023_cov_1.064935_1_plen_78_part_00
MQILKDVITAVQLYSCTFLQYILYITAAQLHSCTAVHLHYSFTYHYSCTALQLHSSFIFSSDEISFFVFLKKWTERK